MISGVRITDRTVQLHCRSGNMNTLAAATAAPSVMGNG